MNSNSTIISALFILLAPVFFGKLLYLMDWDLWESSYEYDQVTLEGSDGMQSEWQCDFYFGYERDVKEEDALNKKCCIQVLRILITKADTEIDELEKELVFLEAELACTEHEEWLKIFCTSLREKIDCLEVSVKSLRNKYKNEANIQSSLRREPAEELHDMFKDLLSRYFQEKDKQSLPLVTVLDSRSDASKDANKPFGSRELRLESAITVKEERDIIPGERCTLMNSAKLQEKKKSLESSEPVNTSTTDPGPDWLRSAAGYSDEREKLEGNHSESTTRQLETTERGLILAGYPNEREKLEGNHSESTTRQLETTEIGLILAGYPNEREKLAGNLSESTTRQLETIERGLTLEDKKIMQNASSRHEEKSSCNLEVAKPADVIHKASISASLESENGCFKEMRSLGKSHLDVNGNAEVRKQQSTSTEDCKVLNSSLNAEGSRTDQRTDEPADIIHKASISASLESANGCFKEMRSLCKSHLEVDGNVEVRKQQSTSTENCKVLNSSLNAEGSRTDELANAIVRYTGPDSLLQLAAASEKNRPSESKLEISRLSIEHCDLEQKLIDFYSPARKGASKDSKIFPLIMLDSSYPLSKTIVNQRDQLQIVTNLPKGVLALRDQTRKTRKKTELKEVGLGEPQLEESQMAIVPACDKSIVKLDLKPENPRAKRNSRNTQSLGPSLPQTEIKLNASASSGKRHRNSNIDEDDDNASLKQLIVSKHPKKSVPHRSCAKEHGTLVAMRNHPLSLLQKGKNNSHLPLSAEAKSLTVDCLNSHGHATNSRNEYETQIVCFNSDDNPIQAVVPSAPSKSAAQELEKMKVKDLKVIAKKHEVAGYYKMRKINLIDAIIEKRGR
ncbi:hypothetical protein UlMin_006064 [Ulmus minor]